jgi:alpha-glucosidase/oligosaccharide 4-alpha-D-glucosyltransferase
MRAGYSGSQRFGLIPWSGDVSRGWGGLQSQVEIALQMGMQGLAYMHSDLGGFAGPVLDDELYVRWLQYGVFQPVFRPHAQADVPPEPVFRDDEAKALARAAVRLRYAMLPYNYTTAFDNSRTGMPLMRPVLFDEPEGNAAAVSSTYLWGPDFLVAPVVEPGATRKEVYFPVKDSTWFDFYTDKPHHGGILEVVRTVPEHIPVFVRAGAFVPMAPVVQTTRDYSTRRIELHYYHDESVRAAAGKLYDDDGETAQAFERGRYEIVRFASSFEAGTLKVSLAPETGQDYVPFDRSFALKVHNVRVRPHAVRVGARAAPFKWDARRKLLEVAVPLRAREPAGVSIVM